MFAGNALLVSELSDDFDEAYDVSVEFVEVFSRNPVFLMGLASDSFLFVTIQERSSYTKPRYTPKLRIVIFRVPVPSDLDRVFFGDNRIKDGLFGKPSRKSRMIALSN